MNQQQIKPTCAQISAACRMYTAGATANTFRQAFGGELNESEMALLWAAAKAAYVIDFREWNDVRSPIPKATGTIAVSPTRIANAAERFDLYEARKKDG
jgi:hypothetical protein